MSVTLYMDVNVCRAVTEGLRLRGAEVVTAQEDGTREWEDNALLDRATELGYVLFTQDDDLLREATQRQERWGQAKMGRDKSYSYRARAASGNPDWCRS